MCDEPELGGGPTILVIRGNEPQDVVVPEHAGLVHLHLSHPRCFIQGGEYLHSNIAPSPHPSLNLTKPPLANNLLQHYLPGNSALQ